MAQAETSTGRTGPVRAAPAASATPRLHGYDMGLGKQLAQGAVVKSLEFNGHGTPLTALKACIKVGGDRLNALSLYGEGLPNPITVKDIGKCCVNLTRLDLCCGGKGGSFDRFTMEEAIIEAAGKLPRLTLLRVAPMICFNTFHGDWKFVRVSRR